MTKYIIKPEYHDARCGCHYAVYKVGWFKDKYISFALTIEGAYTIIKHLEQTIEQVPRL
jgi:hypothetical protein